MYRKENDRFANQGFAMVAVVILLLAAASVTIIYAMNQQEMKRVSRTRTAIILDDIANGNHVTITNTAENLAWIAIYYAAEVKRDTGNLSVEFKDSFENYIESNYPQKSGRYTVNVTEYNVSLTLKTYDYIDVLPPAATYDNKAKADQYKPANVYLGGEVKQTNGFVCYQLTGYVNYSVNDTIYESGLSKTIRVDKVLKDKHPFLSDKFSSLKADGSKDSNGIGRIVKYILTTVAQFRTSQGWAWHDGKLAGALSDLAGAEDVAEELTALSDKKAMDLLTANDVELATNLAVLLVEVKAFRTYDPGSMDALEGKFPGIKAIVEKWLCNDRMDPADIIVLYYGYGSKAADQPLNLKLIVAQAFYAIVDQLILKYMSLMGIDPIVLEVFESLVNFTNMIDDAIEAGTEYVKDLCDGVKKVGGKVGKIISSLGSRADEEVTATLKENTRQYIATSLNNAGIGTYVFKVPITGWPKYLIDINKTFNTRIYATGSPISKTMLTNYSLDADNNISNGYETNVTKNVTYIDQYNTRLYNVDIKIKPQLQEVRFDPVDITSKSSLKDKIWENYYTKYLKMSVQ